MKGINLQRIAVPVELVAVPHGDQHGDDGHARAISHPETADL